MADQDNRKKDNNRDNKDKNRRNDRGPQTKVYIREVGAELTAGKKDLYTVKITLDVTAPTRFPIPIKVFVGSDYAGIIDVVSRATKEFDGLKLDLKQDSITVRIERAGSPGDLDKFELRTDKLKKATTQPTTSAETKYLQVRVGFIMPDGSNPVMITTKDPATGKLATGKVIISCGLDFEVGSAGGWSPGTLAMPYELETEDSGVSQAFIKVPENCSALFFHVESSETVNRMLVKKR